MSDQIDWKELLRIAYEEAAKSPDPSTQNGAILVDEQGNVLVKDHNRFPKNVKYLPERWERPLKYKVIEHAERNVIFKQARQPSTWHKKYDGVVSGTQGMTMVCPWAACSDCARAIIEAGIVRLVTHKQAGDRSPDFWRKEIDVAFTMLREAGVEIIEFDGEVGGPEVRHSGETWNP